MAQPDRTLPPAVQKALAMLGGRRLTVMVNDPQRHTASREVLREISRHVAPRHVRILVATGSHVFAQDVKRAFALHLRADLPFGEIAWHDCRSADLVPVGPGGWRGHPWLLEDPGLLAVGSTEPHYLAGFTGAYKTCTIGCASHEDIRTNHAAALTGPACRPCRLAGNPVHEGIARMVESLQAGRALCAVNLVQRGSRILAVAAGGPLEALGALTRAAESAFVRRIASPADAVVAEVTGPLAGSFYQADKGIKNNEWAVRDGGCLVLVAACENGIGQGRFVELLREAATYEQALALAGGRGYRLGDHKAVRLRHLTDPACRGVRVLLVCGGLTDEQARILGAARAETPEEALRSAGVDPDRDRVVRISDAGNACLLPGGN